MNFYESLTTGYMNKEERDKIQKELYQTKFKSSLKVFSDHNGFIDGEFHTLVGTKGAGKSTWSKTMCSEFIYQDKMVLLYISEESRGKYLHNLNENMLKIFKNESKLKEMMSKIIIFSELDSRFKSESELFGYMKEVIVACEIDILLFDNFTTSFLGETSPSVQSKTLRDFKALADEFQIPVIMLFHTAKLYDAKRIDGDNVRGSATAINIGSYNYVIAQHKDGDRIRNFVLTEKARYHSKSNKKFYEVIYNHDVGLFVDCKDYYIEDYVELVSGGKKKNEGFK